MKGLNNMENNTDIKTNSTQANNNATAATERKTPIFKKWWFWLIIGVLVVALIAGGSTENSGDQGSGSVTPSGSSSTLGDFKVVISSCRIVEDYKGDPVAIITYEFTNNGDDPAAFIWSLNADAYQNGIGLTTAYFFDDSVYSSDNQMKEIKKGATLSVDVAYTLNDETTPIDIEVSEIFSLTDKKITKTFTISD